MVDVAGKAVTRAKRLRAVRSGCPRSHPPDSHRRGQEGRPAPDRAPRRHPRGEADLLADSALSSAPDFIVDVELIPTSPGYDIEACVRTTAQTGVEMEALTAVSVAALTIYDMVKAVDKRMVIGQIRLMKKSGGKSGPS